MEPSVSVIVRTYKRESDLERCLESLVMVNYPEFEVVIVSGDQERCLQRLLGKFKTVKWVFHPPQGLANARNVGVENSNGEIIVFVDDDCEIPSPTWLTRLVNVYSSRKVGGVGGRILAPTTQSIFQKITCFVAYILGAYDDNSIFYDTRVGIISDTRIFGNFDKDTYHTIDVDHLIGCNMSLRRKALSEVGYFDENFDGTGYREETDLCIRMRKKGYRLIYEPNAVAMHHAHFGQKGILSIISEFYYVIRNTTFLFYKNRRSSFDTYIIYWIMISIIPIFNLIVMKGLLDGVKKAKNYWKAQPTSR